MPETCYEYRFDTTEAFFIEDEEEEEW